MDAIFQALRMTGLGSWLAVGLLAAVGARFLAPGRAAAGCLVTGLAGVGGALLGGLLATYLRFGGLSAFDLRSLVIAALGALLFLMLLRLTVRSSKDDA